MRRPQATITSETSASLTRASRSLGWTGLANTWKSWPCLRAAASNSPVSALDLIRSGAFDRAAARAFAGELKNVAEYPSVLSVLARVEANDMFRFLTKCVPFAHPLLFNFAHVLKFSGLMVNRRPASFAKLTVLAVSH
jgi:hypothetical protein